MSEQARCTCRCHAYGPGSNVTCDVGPVQPGGNRSCTPVHTDEPVVAAAEHEPVIDRVDPRDLWAAADKLTHTTRHKLWRDDGRLSYPEHVTIPSLWTQLVEAIDSGAGAHTRGVQRSKAPCDDTALSLTVEIATAVRDGCFRLRIKRTRDVPRDLRSILSATIRSGDQAAMHAAGEQLRTWAARIKATVRNDPNATWRMHGATCRVCASKTVPAFDEEGRETRVPALEVHSAEGMIDYVVCSFCGSRLSGPDLTKIVLDTLKTAAADATTAQAC